eukprot:superscaffoldBa00000286_g3504
MLPVSSRGQRPAEVCGQRRSAASGGRRPAEVGSQQRLTPPNPPDIQPAETDLPSYCGKPTKLEIKKNITQLKNSTAAGPDNIPAESLKADMDTSVEKLHPLFEKIWEKEGVPADWKEGYLVKLPSSSANAMTTEESCFS